MKEAKPLQPTPAESVTKAPSPESSFSLLGIVLREAHYTEVDVATPPLPQKDHPEAIDTDIDLTGTINIFESNVAELMLSIRVRPDPKFKPLDLFVRMSAGFSSPAGAEPNQVIQWVNQVGMLILFPYLREAISNITSRSPFGPVFLNPMQLQSLSLLDSKPTQSAEE